MKEKQHAAIIHTLWLHFYHELNDFLPEEQKNSVFPCHFVGAPSIKDAIEAIGVPHTEIDLIFVNGKSVNFDYRVYGGEQVCVYPQCELFVTASLVHLHPKPPLQIKFIVDANLGKLAIKLRLLGFDTLYKNDFADREIVELSLREQRIILTRDKGVLKYRAARHGYWVRNDKPKKQLKEVVCRLQLHNHFNPFTRCSDCNAQLQPVDKASIKERLAAKTLQFVDEFMVCPSCNKVYWQGSHSERFRKYIDEL
jgi:hypothetical protein